MVVYKAYQYASSTDAIVQNGNDANVPTSPEDNSRLGIRFSRIDQDIVLSHDAQQKPQEGTAIDTNLELETSPQSGGSDSRLVPFENISGYAGVFLTGKKPVWVLCSIKSPIRVHPMATSRAIQAFTPFHNVNVHHGFLTADDQVQ